LALTSARIPDALVRVKGPEPVGASDMVQLVPRASAFKEPATYHKPVRCPTDPIA
jgi:hypothetical protein